MKKYIVLLLCLIACRPMAVAQDEIDTIPEYYQHYMFQWVDDSADRCYHDGTLCMREWNDLCCGGGCPATHFDTFNFTVRPHVLKTYAAQYEVSDSTKVIGIAAVLSDFYTTGGAYSYNPDTIFAVLNLYKPIGLDMQLLKDDTISLADVARIIRLPNIWITTQQWDSPYEDYDYFFSTYEIYFDEPVVVTDSFCIGWSPLYDCFKTAYLPVKQTERHRDCGVKTLRMPLNKIRYRLKSDPPDAPWHLTQEHVVLCLMPIVERPCDTCGVVRDFRQQWIADQTLFVQWDTLPNHTSWQLSYCAAGTDPDHGTIVDCPLPQAVVGNVVGASDMVFHVRARCKDIRWRQWSPWSEAQPVALNAVEAPDGGPDALTVSPNPTTGALHIDCSAAITAVEVYSLHGELLLAQPAHRSTALDLDISSLPQALYLLLVHTDKGTLSRVVARQ